MTINELIWYKDPEHMWLLGKVINVKKDETCTVESTITGKSFQMNLKDGIMCDPSHTLMCTDIAKMNNLHEAPLLDLLRRRYKEDSIYTYVSDILIAVS